MALKNAYSKINIQQLFNNMQKILAQHKAQQIVFEYNDMGQIIGLTFVIKVNERFLPIKLPARIKEVGRVLKAQGFEYDDEQIYRVAWRNINDWIEAQMAMLDSQMVKMEEIFLPYITDKSGITYFEKLERKQFLLES